MHPRLSIVVPFYNEEQSIGRLHHAVVQAVDPLDISYEIIFVDDGSSDGTFNAALELAQTDTRLQVVKLRRNYGQTAALAAGIDQASGEIVVTMDGDLQSDPRDIGLLLRTLDEGYDVVVGWRHQRQDYFLSRRVPSRAANWLIGKITGAPVRDNGCPMKAYRAAVIKAIPLYSEMHRFIPALASITGARIAEVKVRHHARRFGRSKYGLSRTYKVLLDLLVVKTLTSFTSRPLLWFFLLAAPMLAIATLALSYTAYTFAQHGEMSLPIAGSGLIFLFSAAILISSGVLGELIYKVGDVREHRFSRLTQRVL